MTAEFNRNVLRVLNRELAADFDPDAFDHVAVFDADAEWIEMRLRVASGADRARRATSSSTSTSPTGEEIRTEISAKFRREGVERELAAAGLELAEWWTDPAGDFALSLSFALSGACDRPYPRPDGRTDRDGPTTEALDVPAARAGPARGLRHHPQRRTPARRAGLVRASTTTARSCSTPAPTR